MIAGILAAAAVLFVLALFVRSAWRTYHHPDYGWPYMLFVVVVSLLSLAIRS